MSCLSTMLTNSSTLDFSRSKQLQRQCLRTLGIIITSSPPSTFSMLFAQQLPSILCQCLDPGHEFNVRLMSPRPGATGRTELLGFGVGNRLTTFAYCVHTLAVLLHTVSTQWGNIPFPLEVVLVPGLLNDFDQVVNSSPLSSSRSQKKESFGVNDDDDVAVAKSDEKGETLEDSTTKDFSPSQGAEAMYTTTGSEKVSLRQVTYTLRRVAFI